MPEWCRRDKTQVAARQKGQTLVHQFPGHMGKTGSTLGAVTGVLGALPGVKC